MAQSANRSTTSQRKDVGIARIMVKGGRFDYQLLFIVVTIVLFGIMMVYSSSSYRATFNGLKNYYFALKQLKYALFGFFLMYIASKVNYKLLRNLANLGMAVGFVLNIIVLFVGKALNGSTRWIPIGSFQFQPSEIFKLILVIYLAHSFVYYGKQLEDVRVLIRIMAVPIISIGMIASQNLSTAIVCFAILLVMYFIASPSLKNVIILFLGAVIVAVLFVMFKSYRGNRFDAWLHPETSDSGFQVIQSLYAIGSGGLFGRGLGNSMQKMGFLPESHNDMIFSVICEELGLFGAFVVLLLFIMLLMRCRAIANNAPDRFSGLVVSGILTHIAVQTGVNVAVVTNLIPNTGVTLPFISYGGTSIICLLVEIGVVLCISRQTKVEE